MPAKSTQITLTDLYTAIEQQNKRFDKCFGKLEDHIGEVGLLVNGLNKVVHVLSHDLKDLKEYTEVGFDTMNDRFDMVEERLDRIEGGQPPALSFYEH